METDEPERLLTPIEAALSAHRAVLDATARTVRRSAVLHQRFEDAASVDVGETPSSVVYTENKLELHRYESLTETQHDVPILLVYALINRPYILDLQPDRSVVRRLLEAGHDVYLIDWGEPSRLDASLGLADYVDRYVDNCVDVVRERSGQDAINLFGYCMGGTMSAIYAARHPEKVNALALLAAALHFEDTGGILELWGKEDVYAPRTVVDALGNLPGDFLAVGFAAMDPVANYVSKYLQLYDRLENEDFVENFARMETWLGDSVDLTGETYVEFLEEIYQDNALSTNELTIGGQDVDVGAIDMPVLQIVGEYDRLVPPAASVPFNDVVGSERVTTIEYPTGHVGMAMSNAAHRDVWPEVAEWFLNQSTEPALADVIADGIEEALGIDVSTDVTVGNVDEVEIGLADDDGEIARAIVAHDARSVETFLEETLDVEIGLEMGEEGIAVTVETDEGVLTTAVEHVGAAIRSEIEEAIADVNVAAGYDLVDLEGIGQTYAGRLHQAGITSVSELAVSDARRVADAAQASTALAETWIDRARTMVGAADADAGR